MDWNSEATRKHISEAKAQGCELIGPGKDFNFRLYRLPCGHEQEIQPTHMRRDNFRCQTCLDNKLREEAEEQGCALLGPGKNANFRLYRLPCGHEQQIGPNRMREERFRCQTCLDTKIRGEARAQDCEILGPGKNANFRLYRLPCGHEQQIQTGNMRDGGFQCQICQENNLRKEAAAQGCKLLGPGKNAMYRLYRLPCGHQQEIRVHHLREEIFRCGTCLDIKLRGEAKVQGCELLGSAEKGMQCPWRWNGGMISLNLGVIWEMSPKIISAAKSKAALISPPSIMGLRSRRKSVR